MQCSEQLIEKVLVVELSGRLDLDAEYELMKSSDSWLRGKPHIVIDCTNIDFIDSSGLGLLLRILKRAINDKRDIRLAAINEQVRMLFEITRADKVFQIFPTVKEAVRSYDKNRERNKTP